MATEQGDLALLARGRGAGGQRWTKDDSRVPMPKWRWKTRLLLPGGLLLAAAATLVYAAGAALRPATDVRVVPVMVKSGVQEAGAVSVQAPGWVEADPFAVAVSTLADGVVADVLVLEGERVKAGEVVAHLVPDDARLAVAGAEAELAQRQAELLSAQARQDAAQRDWDNPVELTRKLATAKADLAEKRAELDRWPAELAREQAHAVYMKAEYLRIKPLHEAGQASDIELIQARQNHEAQEAAVTASLARRPIIEAQIVSLEAEVEAASEDFRLRIDDRRALDEARAAVDRARAAVAAAQAARDEARLWLERTEIRSPVDGIVMVRLAQPGSKLMLGADNPHGAQVMRVYDPDRLQVRVDVPLVDAAKVGVGQQAEVIVDVLPDRVFRGRVTRVVHEADVQKNTLQVKVAMEDPSPEIKPEMLARARFLAQADAQRSTESLRVFVPEKLVQRGEGSHSQVWLADQARNVALLRTVTPGSGRVGEWMAVDEGLQPGDRLIVDPPSELRQGQRVRIVGEQDASAW